MWTKMWRGLAALVITLFVLALVFPVFSPGVENARPIFCASNMKQIGIALDQYAQDSDGCLPPYASADGQQTWREAVYPFVKSTGVFFCPDDKADYTHATPEHLAHSYAANYIGAYNHRPNRGLFAAPGDAPTMLTKLPDPHTMIALVDMRGYSGPEWNIVSPAFLPASGRRIHDHVASDHKWFQSAPKVGGNFLFADGHVKRMKPLDTIAPINLWTRDNSAFTGQDLANAQAILKHAQEE